MFDEFEEWSIKCDHYFVVIASKGHFPTQLVHNEIRFEKMVDTEPLTATGNYEMEHLSRTVHSTRRSN